MISFQVPSAVAKNVLENKAFFIISEHWWWALRASTLQIWDKATQLDQLGVGLFISLFADSLSDI